MCPPTPSQVLDLPSKVVMVVPSPSEQPASAYKAAVDHFIQSDSSSSWILQEQEETSLPDVQESNTQLLQQLMASAMTLTAREDLLNTLRSVSLPLQYLTPICLNGASVSYFQAQSEIFIGDNTPPSLFWHV